MLPSQGDEENDPNLLKIVVKADVAGSLDAFMDYIDALPTDTLRVQVVKCGLGNVTKADVDTARMLGAQLFAFRVKAPRSVLDQALQDDVVVNTENIIYSLMDSLRDTLSGLLPPSTAAKVTGTASLLKVFDLNHGRKVFKAAGCKVTSGVLTNDKEYKYRVRRDDTGETLVHDAAISALLHFKDSVKTVDKGKECCLTLGDFDSYRAGDVIECYRMEPCKPVFNDSAARAPNDQELSSYLAHRNNHS